jgi:hypothetical protein
MMGRSRRVVWTGEAMSGEDSLFDANKERQQSTEDRARRVGS